MSVRVREPLRSAPSDGHANLQADRKERMSFMAVAMSRGTFKCNELLYFLLCAKRLGFATKALLSG